MTTYDPAFGPSNEKRNRLYFRRHLSILFRKKNHQWIDPVRPYLTPSGAGSGNNALYSFRDIEILAVWELLRENAEGNTGQWSGFHRVVLNEVREHGPTIVVPTVPGIYISINAADRVVGLDWEALDGED